MPTTAENRRIWAQLRRWKLDPIGFVREQFQVEPDPWQCEVLAAFPHHNRLVMKACKGPGKTALLSWLGWNFLATRPHCRIGATSITEGNLQSALWPEFAKWQNRSPFLSATFAWTSSQIVHRAHAPTWWCQARSWPKKGNADEQAHALAGLHEDYAMWLLDELGGYPQAVMATAEAVLLSGIETKVVGSGNPTHTTGPLYRACTTDKGLWHVTTITGDPDNPRAWVNAPRVATRADGGLTPADHARQQIRQYGRDNPWVMVNILGEFPPASINALLGVEEVEQAMARHLTPDVYMHMQKRIGVDVARFGDDRTVMFPRQGLAAFKPIVMRHNRGTAVSHDIAARLIKAKKDWGSELELIDDTVGWAHGTIDAMVVGGYSPVPVNYAGKALDPRYKNRRCEMWMKGADAIRAGAALPNIPEMVGELCEPTYTFAQGQFLLEPKDLVKERLSRSPDLADAYMITYAVEDMPGEFIEKLRNSNRAKTGDDAARGYYERGEPGRADHDRDPYHDRLWLPWAA